MAVNERYLARKNYIKSRINGYKSQFTAPTTASLVALGGDEFVNSIKATNLPANDAVIKRLPTDKKSSSIVDEIHKAGTMLYAVNTYNVNSDLNSKLIFNIFGVERGSKLYKSTIHGSVELVYDNIVANFTNICTAQGDCFAIEGVGIDPGTSELAINGDIDRHFWYRFGGLSLAALFQGGAEAVKSSRERTEQTDETGKTVTYSGLDTDKLLISSTGVLAETLSGVFTENVTRPYTGTIDKDEEIGIFLLEDLVIQTPEP